MKYFKWFQTNDEYEVFKNTNDFILPNVSAVGIKNDYSLKCHPYVAPKTCKLKMQYNATTDNLSLFSRTPNNINRVFIDGEELILKPSVNATTTITCYAENVIFPDMGVEDENGQVPSLGDTKFPATYCYYGTPTSWLIKPLDDNIRIEDIQYISLYQIYGKESIFFVMPIDEMINDTASSLGQIDLENNGIWLNVSEINSALQDTNLLISFMLSTDILTDENDEPIGCTLIDTIHIINGTQICKNVTINSDEIVAPSNDGDGTVLFETIDENFLLHNENKTPHACYLNVLDDEYTITDNSYILFCAPFEKDGTTYYSGLPLPIFEGINAGFCEIVKNGKDCILLPSFFQELIESNFPTSFITFFVADLINDIPTFKDVEITAYYSDKIAIQFNNSGSHDVYIEFNDRVIDAEISTTVATVEFVDVKNIGKNAFSGCTGLTSVIFNDTLENIGDYAFYGCSGLTGEIVFPNTVNYIGSQAFMSCSGITSVILPNNIQTISDSSFAWCPITKVEIPKSVTNIGGFAFAYTSLTDFVLPKNVTSIGNRLLAGCDELITLKVEDGNTKYDSRDNCNCIIDTTTNTLMEGSNTSFIPETVTSINSHAFEGRYGLTSIEIPSSVVSLGSNSIFSSTNITTIIAHGMEAPSAGMDTFSGIASYGTLYTYPEAIGYVEWMSTEKSWLGYYDWNFEYIEDTL